jgi:hypothetical protein
MFFFLCSCLASNLYFLYTSYIFILSLICNVLSFLQHQSGAASNHVGGSAASHGVLSTPGLSSGSQAGASQPSPASHTGPSPWAAFRVVFMYWACELRIMCTFEGVVCNIFWILYKFDRLWYINVVCDILLLICGLCYIYNIYALLFTWKSKKQKKKDFQRGFPECLGCGARGRGCLPRVPALRRSWKRVSSPSVALGEDFF